jgi:hypothetical protein
VSPSPPSETVVIDRRFRGPPDSGQGGYSCGLVGTRIDGDCATVTLRKPPPLDRELTLESDGDAARLLDGETLIAEGVADTLELDVPEAPSLEVARHGSDYPYWDQFVHPFPGCFACGPERNQDEAVAIWMGSISDTERLMAGAWTPSPGFAGDDGAVTPLITWAALDCPTATGANLPMNGVSVLGRLTCRLIAPIEPGVTHTVAAWPIGDDGRKHTGAAAVYAPGGTLCAYSAGLWIELRDPATMGAKTA